MYIFMNSQLVVTRVVGNRVEELLLAHAGQLARAAPPAGAMRPETALFPGADKHQRVHL